MRSRLLVCEASLCPLTLLVFDDRDTISVLEGIALGLLVLLLGWFGCSQDVAGGSGYIVTSSPWLYIQLLPEPSFMPGAVSCVYCREETRRKEASRMENKETWRNHMEQRDMWTRCVILHCRSSTLEFVALFQKSRGSCCVSVTGTRICTDTSRTVGFLSYLANKFIPMIRAKANSF